MKNNFTDSITGLSEKKALDKVTKLGYSVRVIDRDGKKAIVTRDYVASRLNLSISGGLVVNAYWG